MAFCTKCGTEVRPQHHFCAKCGAPQTGPAGSRADTLAAPFSARTASVLCYIPFAGWIFAIIVLASERFRTDRDVRFHAFQGLYLFVVWLIVDMVFDNILGFLPHPGAVLRPLKLAMIGAWVYMMYKTNQGETVRLPVLCDLADRSVAEQR